MTGRRARPAAWDAVWKECAPAGKARRSWSYFLMAATHLAILGMAAGRTLGVDQLLRPRVTGTSILARAYRLAS